MNCIAPRAEPLIREIPLSRLSLAPENFRKTPPDPQPDASLKASIAALGLLENLVARTNDPGEDGAERYTVVAGGRRLIAMQALVEDGLLDADHPVPCLPDAGTGQEGHDHRSGRIGEEPPGPDFGVNVNMQSQKNPRQFGLTLVILPIFVPATGCHRGPYRT